VRQKLKRATLGMIDFIVVAYVDSGADSVSRHLAMDEKEAYLSWARELNNHFDFGADFDYVCNETPMKVELKGNLIEFEINDKEYEVQYRQPE